MVQTEQPRVRGHEALRAAPSALRTTDVNVTVKAEFRPGRSRAGTERLHDVPLGKDDLVEIEYEDGLRIWLTPEEYRDKLAEQGSRDAVAHGILEVPDSLEFGGADAASRGVVGWLLKSLKIIGVDVGERTALAVARSFESKEEAPQRIGLGLFRCNVASGGFALEALPAADSAGGKGRLGPNRCLIFLHGTASSTYGSFGELWSPQRAPVLNGLRRLYGDDVFGFEHRSMTEGPIENALALAEDLAARVRDGTEIDLISHSRGGLIGELVCRMTAPSDAPPFDDDDITLAGSATWLETATDLDKKEREEARKALEQAARKLVNLSKVLATLRQRNVRIRRFVRVACPALGTSLASRRLDRWAQILLNVGSLAARASPIAGLVDSLGDFLAVVIRQKTRPEVLPGLAAMLPDAGLLRSINSPVRPVRAELAVIAGDLEADTIWKRLLTLVADRFYAGEHDLVVNTGSMYGGAPRAPGVGALLAYQSGDSVNHFNYFRNERSATALLRALEITEFSNLEGSESGFESMRRAVKPIAREVSRGPTGPRPTVFVLPGIMGSEIAVGGQPIWLNPPALFLGGLARLRYGTANVVAQGLYAPYYDALIDYLADSHKVIPFPYDWRLSPYEEAKRLAIAVRDAVKEAGAIGHPVRIIAHSMGGLVARSMIAQYPDVWKAMTAVPGARLVMLGTPNGGSHAINELIVGQSSTIRRLALADIRNPKRALLDVIAQFPGVLSLLPSAAHGADDYMNEATWNAYLKGSKGDWTVPNDAALKSIRELHDTLARDPVDANSMVYVAGQAPETLVGMRLEKGRIRFKATNRGDGQVPWDSGILPGLKAWFMPGVLHGNLPSTEQYFPALLDLLQRGATTRLRQDEPVSRDAVIEWDVERGTDEMLPDEDAIAAAALGGTTPKARRRRIDVQRIRVTVMHGHLKFADWPVLVGHYKGDTIISAERALDSELDGRLTHRHRLGLYPAELKTFEVVLRKRPGPSPRWRGGIVVGIGPVGELGVGGLVATITHGLLAYAVRILDTDFETGNTGSTESTKEIGVSALLVGTNAGGVSDRDSVLALLEGVVAANQELQAAKRPIRITSLQLVELLQSKALQAVEDLQFLAEETRLRGFFTAPGRLDTRRGARSQLVFKEPAGWWQRLQIKGKSAAGEPEYGALRFVALTRRARADSRLVATQRALVDRFVKQTISSTRNDREVCRTLFELLLPNPIKEQSPNRDKLVLVLDEEAARYPWEMLENRWDGDGTPLALNRGLLRQLELENFRETPIRSLGHSVLIIGDPELPDDGPFRPLPGAHAEAEAVAGIFEQDKRFEVVSEVGETAGRITRALFRDAYRVVHLAGHGVYELPNKSHVGPCDACGQEVPQPDSNKGSRRPTITGMVLGDGAYLTPGEVEQMRRVPELVFINCCHLGHVEGRSVVAGEAGRSDLEFSKFAANVATQFMRMGVRAVVAAGWAVDDAAAKTFALVFYRQMLDGRTFGDAVLTARQETAKQHPHVNTWGAYQCYGDPDYFLVQSAGQGFRSPEPPVSPEQFINRVEGIIADIESAGAEGLNAQLRELDGLKSLLAADPSWSRRGRAWAALARAYNEAFQYETAVECYRTAVKQEDGGLTIQDAEQWTACECQIALTTWRSTETDRAGQPQQSPSDEEEQIRRAIKRLHGLHTSFKDDAVTSVRLSILARAHQRLAWLCLTRGTPERVGELSVAMSYYKAATLLESSGTVEPLLNWAAMDLALRWQERVRSPDHDDLDRRLALARAALEAMQDHAADVAVLTTYADLLLLMRLRSSPVLDTQQANREDDQLRDTYCEVRRLSNERDFQSVIEQLDFLWDMARMAKPGDRAAVDLLTRLRSVIDTCGGSLPPAQRPSPAREKNMGATERTARKASTAKTAKAAKVRKRQSRRAPQSRR